MYQIHPLLLCSSREMPGDFGFHVKQTVCFSVLEIKHGRTHTALDHTGSGCIWVSGDFLLYRSDSAARGL